LAFVLSFVVLYAFRSLYSPPATEPPSTTSSTTPPVSAPVAASPKAAEVSQPAEAPPATAENIKAEKPEEFIVDTPVYRATVSNIGGVLRSFKLKKYSDGEGQPVELIDQQASTKVGWPLTLVSGDKAVDDQLQKGFYVGHRDANQLTLEFASDGVYARKIIKFDEQDYAFTLETSLLKDGKAIPATLVWQGNFGDQSIPQDPAKKNGVYQVDMAFKRVALRSLKDQPQDFSSPRAGVDDQYFLAALLGDSPGPVRIRKQEYSGPDGKPVPTLSLAVLAPEHKPLRVYVGPKQRDALNAVDPQLGAVLDYGYFGFIAKPLLFVLLWLHSFIGNFGWAIILLTVAMNLVLFPLAVKQQTSMIKMQKIQPQMKRLQDQYKKLKPTDPRRAQVQTEMMNLYKEHGVNPMGGCLPLLLQMPLFFGFYSALAYSIELRRAPWILWIKDLSQYDPYYVIPILMAVAMIVQQKLTPTANVDPAQAKMMLLMPVMMIFLFLSYSSGLSLYWFTGSVVGIARQVVINKYWSPQAQAKISARARSNEPRTG
jgi:YidC/Oxa1 family membrane protein insertase